jgi:hypothetical protein
MGDLDLYGNIIYLEPRMVDVDLSGNVIYLEPPITREIWIYTRMLYI